MKRVVKVIGHCSTKYKNTTHCGMKNRNECAFHALRSVSTTDTQDDHANQERAKLAASWAALTLH